ncbi:MAG: response regulator transcription factor [Chloroflexi bacterium]|nr:response regulator transcription factor [Chloroflexota bacterium]
MADVLVVEDDAAIRDVVVYQLTRAGHHVDAAGDGVTALERFRATRPDLLILDLMLPRLAGLDVLRIVRDETAVPVIVISARDTEADKITGFDLGADDYLTKPFSVRELLARVQVVLRRGTGEQAPTLAGGATGEPGTPIVIDADRHEVRKRGELIALAPKEFELLAYLVRHPNQVCTRDQILESVWGYTYEGETRTVDVHVHWLRQKLEDDPARPRHLLTVRHYGYKFSPIPQD